MPLLNNKLSRKLRNRFSLYAVLIAVLMLFFLLSSNYVDQNSYSETMNSTEDSNMAKATFGAGCFWGVEAEFRKLEGVASTAVGYMGGDTENPTYQEVCTDRTGHAEVVEVTYDPDRISYEKLLDLFWEMHDPTTLNRQGPDIGKQYRSVIFYQDDHQKELAEQSKRELDASGKYSNPVVTEIAPAETFYRAEEYHQQYYEKKGITSCRIK